MSAPEKGITVVGVEARDFHRIRFAEVKLVPGTGLVRITGKNRQGKTSLLRSIKAALGGATQVLDAAVVNDEDGKETGSVRLSLSNGFTVARVFTPGAPKGTLTVRGPDGGKYGQGKLEEWLGPLAFDPLGFFLLDPRRQREVLLSLGNDPELAAKIDQVRAQRAGKFEDRTPWISRARTARQIRKPAGERPEPVDTSAEMARLRELQGQQRTRQDAERAIAKTQEQVDRAEDRRGDLDDQAQHIRGQIEALQQKLRELEDEDRRILTMIEAEQGGVAARRAALEQLPDVAADLDTVQSRLSDAARIEQSLGPWREWDRAQVELEQATAKEASLTAEIRALDERERSLVTEAGIPVPGLAFGEKGEPILNGRTLEVASGAERIGMAVAVALAADPELRVCLIDEANDIDLEGLEELDRLAKEHGFQVWACRIGLEGAGEVVVEDGRAWSRDEAPVPAAAAVAGAQEGLGL